MTMRKAWCLSLIVALTLVAVPVGAQSFAPNTIWGQVPQGLSGNVANAVLLDANRNVAATVPVADGKFDFSNVKPGHYTVQIQNSTGTVLASSAPASLAGGGIVRVLFSQDGHGPKLAAGHGHATTLLVAGAALAAGCGTVVYIHRHRHHHQEPPVSGSR